jgi:hypothetical protein
MSVIEDINEGGPGPHGMQSREKKYYIVNRLSTLSFNVNRFSKIDFRDY